MARDRKRAKQRQQRRPQRTPASGGSEIHRADLPGALEHASGDVDEFDAALVRGAGGVPVEAETLPDSGATSADASSERVDRDDLSSDDLAPSGAGGAGRGGDNGTAVEAFGEGAPVPAPRERRQSLPRRAISFLRASWAELQRVQWPNRTQVSQATAVVLGFVAIAGAYLGAADWLAQKIVNLIL
ncbi:MAG TPA: preprotein translocase subunit SecE [Solirubrobacteraceae bacterium]